MRQFYTEEWKWFKEKYLKIFIFVLITYIAIALLSHIVLVNNPVQSQKKFMELTKIISEKIPEQATGIELCLVIFMNNLKVSLFSILLGLIPFIFLPFFGAITNGFSIGIITSAIYIKGLKLGPFLLFTIVPHGILELPSILYAASIGIFLSLQISKRILRGHESSDEPFYLILRRIFKTWVGVIIPLLLVAAIIEAFITPFLVKIFLERYFLNEV
jgi:stage II sporulation protein M